MSVCPNENIRQLKDELDDTRTMRCLQGALQSIAVVDQRVAVLGDLYDGTVIRSGY